MARPKVEHKPYDRNWTLRRTPERAALVEELQAALKRVKPDVDSIYGTATVAAVIDEALLALKRELDRQP